ncbi:MAG: AI-2E family transporter [Alphaproteobacteria bacterium]|nr:MAG: AI-2E family transporter [Alphaproteobacteria bacterium]
MVFSSFLLAYVLSPVHQKLKNLLGSRFISAFLVIFSFCIIFITILVFSLPKLYLQAIGFFGSLQDIYSFLITNYSNLFGENVNESLSKLLINKSNIGQALLLISTYGYDTIGIFFNVAGMIMMTFYMLKDWDLWRTRLLNIVSESYKSSVNIFFEDVMNSLKLWLYGQIYVTLFLFLFYFISFTMIKMPFTLLLSCFLSIFSIIPYLGDIFSTVMVLSVLASFKPFFSQFAICAMLVLLIGFILENVFLIPSLIGKKAGIHPLFLLILFLLFGKILGFGGVILTIPLSVIFASVWKTGIVKIKWF